MIRSALTSSLLLATLTLAACQDRGSSAPSAPAAAPDPAPVTAAPAAPAAPAPEAAAPVADTLESRLATILAGAHRSDSNRARDAHRRPAETLAFFGVSPSSTVIEMAPGGGWYTEILAPLVKGSGQYIAAIPDPSIEGQPQYVYSGAERLREKLTADSDNYGGAEIRPYDVANASLGEPGSADFVLTFRSTHGWINGGVAEGHFAAFHEVLKPGGVLGVVQHRAAEGADLAESSPAGYVPESVVIALAEAAGFALDDRSEVNANPADTRDHPRGVWTLPPNLALGDEEREKYAAIGESDRMTLRFRKPAGDHIFSPAIE